MRLNSWIGLLFHTIIVALCGALIWAMNYFAADWGFLYDHIAIKIIISLLPVLLYWLFAKLLPGKREKSRDFTSGLGIILVSVVVFAVAMVGHRGNFLDQGFGESIWTLPLDVFLLPMVLISSVWHLGYSYIGIGVAAVLPTILYAISRKVSRMGKNDDEEFEEDEPVDEGFEEVDDAEEGVLEAEDKLFTEEEMKVANKNAVATDQTIQWNKEELASEVQEDEFSPEVEPVVTPVSPTASVAGEGLSPEEIAMIMEARAKRQAAASQPTEERGKADKKELPSEMQEMPHVESGSNTPEAVIGAEGLVEDKKADMLKGMQEMPHVESGSNTPTDVIEAEGSDNKVVQPLEGFKKPEILKTREAMDVPEVKAPVISPEEAKEYVDTLVEEKEGKKLIPDFLKGEELGKEAEEPLLTEGDVEDDDDFEEAWEETKDAIKGFFGRDKKRPRRDSSSRSRRNRTGSSRPSRVEKPRIEEAETPTLEVEWRSSRRSNSSLKRPDYTNKASREFNSGEDQIKNILFDDKEQD